MVITITKLKDLIVDALEVIPNPNTNSITIDGEEYILKNATLLGNIVNKIHATNLEVANKAGRTRFSFISPTGMVATFSITHTTSSTATLVE